MAVAVMASPYQRILLKQSRTLEGAEQEHPTLQRTREAQLSPDSLIGVAGRSLVFERHCGDYLISDDPDSFDADALHDFLESEGYCAQGRSREQTAVAVANSVVLSVCGPGGIMVGGARIVTDRATFCWLTDVYVLAEHRGRGLISSLTAAACEHPAAAAVGLMTADCSRRP